MDTIKINFQYTQEEYVEAYRLFISANKLIRRGDFVIYPLMLIFVIFYMVFSGYSALGVAAATVVVLSLITMAAIYLFAPAYRFRQTEKYHEEYSLSFSETEIHFQTPSIDSTLQWNVYTQVWESSKYFFLIQKQKQYTMIPKRSFQDGEQEKAFQSLSAKAIGPIRKLPK